MDQARTSLEEESLVEILVADCELVETLKP